LTYNSKLTVSVGLRTKLYDKRDDFNFPVVNFPFICINFLATPISQNLCFFFGNCSEFGNFVITFSSYRDSLDGGLLPCLRTSCDRHHDLVNRYGISVSQITTDWHGWLDIYFCDRILQIPYHVFILKLRFSSLRHMWP
jgi:hypothetical protein